MCRMNSAPQAGPTLNAPALTPTPALHAIAHAIAGRHGTAPPAAMRNPRGSDQHWHVLVCRQGAPEPQQP